MDAYCCQPSILNAGDGDGCNMPDPLSVIGLNGYLISGKKI